eukprot:Rmarinus@m.23997
MSELFFIQLKERLVHLRHREVGEKRGDVVGTITGRSSIPEKLKPFIVPGQQRLASCSQAQSIPESSNDDSQSVVHSEGEEVPSCDVEQHGQGKIHGNPRDKNKETTSAQAKKDARQDEDVVSKFVESSVQTPRGAMIDFRPKKRGRNLTESSDVEVESPPPRTRARVPTKDGDTACQSSNIFDSVSPDPTAGKKGTQGRNSSRQRLGGQPTRISLAKPAKPLGEPSSQARSTRSSMTSSQSSASTQTSSSSSSGDSSSQSRSTRSSAASHATSRSQLSGADAPLTVPASQFPASIPIDASMDGSTQLPQQDSNESENNPRSQASSADNEGSRRSNHKNTPPDCCAETCLPSASGHDTNQNDNADGGEADYESPQDTPPSGSRQLRSQKISPVVASPVLRVPKQNKKRRKKFQFV